MSKKNKKLKGGYYIKNVTITNGPYSLEELLKKSFAANTRIWSPKTKKWHYARELPELKHLFNKDNPPKEKKFSTPTPLIPTDEQTTTQQTETQNKEFQQEEITYQWQPETTDEQQITIEKPTTDQQTNKTTSAEAKTPPPTPTDKQTTTQQTETQNQEFQQEEITYQWQPEIRSTDSTKSSDNDYQPRINSHIVPAILVTLFCNPIIGIFSIIYAAKSATAYSQKDYEKAQKYANTAKILWLIGLVSIPFLIAFLALLD